MSITEWTHTHLTHLPLTKHTLLQCEPLPKHTAVNFVKQPNEKEKGAQKKIRKPEGRAEVWEPEGSDILGEHRRKIKSAPSAQTADRVYELVKGLLGNSVVFYGCEVMWEEEGRRWTGCWWGSACLDPCGWHMGTHMDECMPPHMHGGDHHPRCPHTHTYTNTHAHATHLPPTHLWGGSFCGRKLSFLPTVGWSALTLWDLLNFYSRTSSPITTCNSGL